MINIAVHFTDNEILLENRTGSDCVGTGDKGCVWNGICAAWDIG